VDIFFLKGILRKVILFRKVYYYKPLFLVNVGVPLPKFYPVLNSLGVFLPQNFFESSSLKPFCRGAFEVSLFTILKG